MNSTHVITQCRSDADYLADETDIKEYLIPALNPNYVKVRIHFIFS